MSQDRTPFQPRCNISSIITFCQTHISNAVFSEKDQFICDYLHQAETCFPIATRSCCPILLLIQFHQIPLFHSQHYQLFISTVGLITSDRNRKNGGTSIPSNVIRNLFRIILSNHTMHRLNSKPNTNIINSLDFCMETQGRKIRELQFLKNGV